VIADTLTLSKIDEAWNGFLSGTLDKDSLVGTITARDHTKDTERIIQMTKYSCKKLS
jgi:hypothetical protein